jgi:hypothetical protein
MDESYWQCLYNQQNRSLLKRKMTSAINTTKCERFSCYSGRYRHVIFFREAVGIISCEREFCYFRTPQPCVIRNRYFICINTSDALFKVQLLSVACTRRAVLHISISSLDTGIILRTPKAISTQYQHHEYLHGK